MFPLERDAAQRLRVPGRFGKPHDLADSVASGGIQDAGGFDEEVVRLSDVQQGV